MTRWLGESEIEMLPISIPTFYSKLRCHFYQKAESETPQLCINSSSPGPV